MLVPKQKLIDEFNHHASNTFVDGNGKFEFNDNEENVYKIFLTIYPNKDLSKAYLEYNFDDKLYLKIYGEYTIVFILNSNLDYHKKHMVKFNSKLFDENEPIKYLNFNMLDGTIEEIIK